MANPNLFLIKQGDTGPAIAATLKDGDGNAVDLTGASLLFKMWDPDAKELVVNAAATIVGASTGQVEYAWAAGDTDDDGTFDAEWQVTYATGEIQTFPTRSFNKVRIFPDLDAAAS